MCQPQRKSLYTPKSKNDSSHISFGRTIKLAVKNKRRAKKKLAL
jgi:hypothetical protein